MAEKLVLVDLNLLGNQLKNVRIETVDSLPTATSSDLGRLVVMGGELYICTTNESGNAEYKIVGDDSSDITSLSSQLAAAITRISTLEQELENESVRIDDLLKRDTHQGYKLEVLRRAHNDIVAALNDVAYPDSVEISEGWSY